MAVLLVALGLAVAIARTADLPEIAGVRLSIEVAMDDFQSAIWCPAETFLDGGDPYDRAEYVVSCPSDAVFPSFLPSVVLLGLPFASLPLGAAEALWIALHVAGLAAIAAFSWRWTGRAMSVTGVLLVVGVLLLSRTGHWGLTLGQPAVLYAFASMVAVYWARRRPELAGICLAVAAVKPSFGVPLAALLLAQRCWRAVVVGVVASIAATLPVLVALVVRSGGIGDFARAAGDSFELYSDRNAGPRSPYGADLPALLTRLIASDSWLVIELAVGAALLVLACWVLWHRTARLGRQPEAPIPASLTFMTVVVSTTHHEYDLLLLVPVALFFALRADLFEWDRPWFRPLALVLFAVLVVNHASSDAVLSPFEVRGPAWLAITSVNALATILLFALTVRLALEPEHPVALDDQVIDLTDRGAVQAPLPGRTR